MKKVHSRKTVTVSDLLTNDSVKSTISSLAAIANGLDMVVVAYTTRTRDIGLFASTHNEAEILGLLEVAKFSIIERMQKPNDEAGL